MIVELNVYICALRKKSAPLIPMAQLKVHSWHHSKFTDRQDGCQSKNFSGTRDIRHLKIFRVISNEMPVLLLILYWCYFSCLKIYSENFFNAFISKCFLKSLWQRERQVSFFWEIIAWTVKFSLPNLRIFSLNFLY